MAPDDCETVANMQAYIESRLAAIREQGSSGGKQASSGGGSERSSDSMGQEPVGLVERLLVSGVKISCSC